MLANIAFITPNWPVPSHVKSLQTTRCGGVSVGAYSSLNLGAHVNDDPIAVARNRQLLSPYLPSEPVWLNQVHGVDVINAAEAGCLPAADAAFTKKPHVVCVTMTADCLPVLLCDKQGTAVAAIHAGWRSLCDGVIEATVAKMQVAQGELLAWLGPAIGPAAFEVGEEVKAQFTAKDRGAEHAFKPDNGKWLCDLYTIAKQRLHAVGVNAIYGASINETFCTFSDKERFFSYRRDQVTGRMATMIWLDTNHLDTNHPETNQRKIKT